MITERSFSLGCVAASALWAMTLFFVLAGTIAGFIVENTGLAVAMVLMTYGLVCSAGAATLTIRNGLAAQNKMLTDAFQLGKESAGAGIRRVGS